MSSSGRTQKRHFGEQQALGRLQDAVTSNDKLVGQLKDADRYVARLKKSDRAKGKVWQRNLRLKTTLNRYASQMAFSSLQQDSNTEAGLLEALALANERIEELESKGSALLDVLEQRNDSYGSDEDENDNSTRLLEAEVALRGVLENETFREQKGQWDDLLKE
jgi:hypothetical protein